MRVWLAIGGNFTDPSSEDLLVGTPTGVKATMTKSAAHIDFATTALTLRATTSPIQFSLLDNTATVLMKETEGLTWNGTTTYQTLATDPAEHIFGGGMQNGMC